MNRAAPADRQGDCVLLRLLMCDVFHSDNSYNRSLERFHFYCMELDEQGAVRYRYLRGISQMPRAYSMDLRERIIAACDRGESAAEVAERYSVSASFIEKLKRRRREEGTLAPKPHAGGRQRLLTDHDETLRQVLEAQPDMTLKELRETLGASVQLSTLWYHLKRLGLTSKNKR